MAPLQEQDINMQSSAPRGTKRSRDVVDLTDDEPRVPHPRAVFSQTTDLEHTDAEREAWLREDDTNIDETVPSSQEEPDHNNWIQYGILGIKIVGVRFYRGMSNPGERVLLRREPRNPYDSNAIRVDNTAMQQLGHVARKMAAKVSKYLDNKWLSIEGILDGELGEFDGPVTLKLYGPPYDTDQGKALMDRMKADKLPLNVVRETIKRDKDEEKERERQRKAELTAARRAAAGLGGGEQRPDGEGRFASHSQPEYKDSEMANILENVEKFDPRRVGESAESYGQDETALADMPMADQPRAIKTQMLPYQRQALHWLLSQEDTSAPPEGSTEIVQLWKRHNSNRNAYVNIATNHATIEAPAMAHGGILADDMGLGKTLEMISLIVADKADNQQAGPTLIVAPLSVMSNWTDQMALHVHADHALKPYVFHGKGATQLHPDQLMQYDVVITTYQTLASDYANSRQNRNTGLYSMTWRRIILDEGHIIRNPQSKGAAAVMAVHASKRWVLTGTPIVNTLKDLYCLLTFVGINGGLQHLEIFNSVLVRPLNNGNHDAILLLKAMMKAFVLRRKKEMQFIDLRLPELSEYVQRLDFNKDERARYAMLEEEAQGIIKDYMQRTEAGRKLGDSFQTLLEILLRMRQCCNASQLVGKRMSKMLAELAEQKIVALTPENAAALRDVLQVRIESQEECAICLEALHQPVITHCGHAFGKTCIERTIDAQHKCPLCRAEVPDSTFLVEAANECGDAKADAVDLDAPSSKIVALIKILNATKNEGKGEKTIIFSQWTSFLDIVESNIERAGFKYTRLDGTMSAAARDSALSALANDDDCTIMLASLGVCAVGLNLVAANNIILSDSWWAPAIEDQAIDRVHRLGQKRPTRVFRLVVDKSIEDTVLDIQQRKRALMRMALSENKSKRDAVKQGRLSDIQQLLGWHD